MIGLPPYTTKNLNTSLDNEAVMDLISSINNRY